MKNLNNSNNIYKKYEYPRWDFYQLILLIIFYSVWILDSFIFNFSTIFLFVIPLFIRILIGLILISIGIVLIYTAHKCIFKSKKKTIELVENSIYKYIRHPMYLGILFIYLGYFFFTISLITLGIWFIIFVFYNFAANYEEKNLEKLFGEKYLNYKKKTGKWFPKF